MRNNVGGKKTVIGDLVLFQINLGALQYFLVKISLSGFTLFNFINVEEYFHKLLRERSKEKWSILSCWNKTMLNRLPRKSIVHAIWNCTGMYRDIAILGSICNIRKAMVLLRIFPQYSHNFP